MHLLTAFETSGLCDRYDGSTSRFKSPLRTFWHGPSRDGQAATVHARPKLSVRGKLKTSKDGPRDKGTVYLACHGRRQREGLWRGAGR